jgi:hypothetical protein
MKTALVAVAAAAAVFPAGASAEERSCRGTIGAATVDNLRVPQGATCALNVSSFVNADILFDENRGPLAIRDNVVGGDVQGFQNRGGLEISRNRIDGNLQCKENSPRPVGGGDVVQGNKEDQCARL